LRPRSASIPGALSRVEKPAELPILRPTKFEFVTSLQTAKTIGLDVPATLLALTDDAIESLLLPANFSALAHVGCWHHPEMPENPDYFRLLMCCGRPADLLAD